MMVALIMICLASEGVGSLGPVSNLQVDLNTDNRLNTGELAVGHGCAAD